jgi:CRP-like cAMP-binding protein
MSDSAKTIEFLTKVSLFDGLNKRQLQKLASRFVSRHYKADTAIVTQGQSGEGLFVIASGGAEAIRERGDGTKVVVNTFGPKDFFGELALLNEGARTASVITTQETECLILARWDFISVMREDAEMGVVISQELAKRFRRALDALS